MTVMLPRRRREEEVMLLIGGHRREERATRDTARATQMARINRAEDELMVLMVLSRRRC